ncbi:MAG: iron ABC transporter permease [Streptosporangiales bacterium]|nr:iron ABC transporter permease [Streptosporangiales bacterium]MBO0890002.1 iron ABC transporter permease [Acidothermales bacterium]
MLREATDSETADHGPVTGRAGGLARTAVPLAVLGVAFVVISLAATSVGRFGVPFPHVLEIVVGRVVPLHRSWTDAEQNVVLLVRLPRILLAALVGGGLAAGGAALQATFRNPLVSPEIIGVSSGASLGGVLALLFGLGAVFQVGGAFCFGVFALALVYGITASRSAVPVLMIVLAGVVTGAFFSALVSLVTYVADPYTTLPAIVFWLLGSVASATYAKVTLAALPILAGVALLVSLRWRINVLSLGDEDAASVGLRPRRLRWAVLAAVALVVAGAVAVSGVISWVGLVVPHLVRMWVGPDHRVLLPASVLMGAIYLVGMDTLARTLTAGEVPLGVLTATVGAPTFFVLLRRNRHRIWDHA